MQKHKKIGASQLLGDKNPVVNLSKKFSAINGSYTTLRELVDAYFKHDLKALQILRLQNMEQLRDVLETMFPKTREFLKKQTSTPKKFKQYLTDLLNNNTPNPTP